MKTAELVMGISLLALIFVAVLMWLYIWSQKSAPKYNYGSAGFVEEQLAVAGGLQPNIKK